MSRRTTNYRIGDLVEIRGRTVRIGRGRYGWTSWLVGRGGVDLPGPGRASRRETIEAMSRLLKGLDGKQ